MKKFIAVISAAVLFLSSCTTMNSSSTRFVASESEEMKAIAAQGYPANFQNNTRANPLEDSEIRKYAAAADIKLIEGQVLLDNDAAFDKKVEMINRAEREIRMVYYIYSNDNSSSVINKALIEAATKRGVKVSLLVDFITNYKFFDLFAMASSM